MNLVFQDDAGDPRWGGGGLRNETRRTDRKEKPRWWAARNLDRGVHRSVASQLGEATLRYLPLPKQLLSCSALAFVWLSDPRGSSAQFASVSPVKPNSSSTSFSSSSSSSSSASSFFFFFFFLFLYSPSSSSPLTFSPLFFIERFVWLPMRRL